MTWMIRSPIDSKRFESTAKISQELGLIRSTYGRYTMIYRIQIMAAHAISIAFLFTLIFAGAFMSVPTLVDAQSYSNFSTCSGAGAAGCYNCSPGGSSPTGAGCQNGSPAQNFIWGTCISTSFKSDSCTQDNIDCGTYVMCLSGKVVGACQTSVPTCTSP